MDEILNNMVYKVLSIIFIEFKSKRDLTSQIRNFIDKTRSVWPEQDVAQQVA